MTLRSLVVDHDLAVVDVLLVRLLGDLHQVRLQRVDECYRVGRQALSSQ